MFITVHLFYYALDYDLPKTRVIISEKQNNRVPWNFQICFDFVFKCPNKYNKQEIDL